MNEFIIYTLLCAAGLRLRRLLLFEEEEEAPALLRLACDRLEFGEKEEDKQKKKRKRIYAHHKKAILPKALAK